MIVPVDSQRMLLSCGKQEIGFLKWAHELCVSYGVSLVARCVTAWCGFV